MNILPTDVTQDNVPILPDHCYEQHRIVFLNYIMLNISIITTVLVIGIYKVHGSGNWTLKTDYFTEIMFLQCSLHKYFILQINNINVLIKIIKNY
jgi:hypothetical protein